MSDRTNISIQLQRLGKAGVGGVAVAEWLARLADTADEVGGDVTKSKKGGSFTDQIFAVIDASFAEARGETPTTKFRQGQGDSPSKSPTQGFGRWPAASWSPAKGGPFDSKTAKTVVTITMDTGTMSLPKGTASGPVEIITEVLKAVRRAAVQKGEFAPHIAVEVEGAEPVAKATGGDDVVKRAARKPGPQYTRVEAESDL